MGVDFCDDGFQEIMRNVLVVFEENEASQSDYDADYEDGFDFSVNMRDEDGHVHIIFYLVKSTQGYRSSKLFLNTSYIIK